MLYVVDEIRRVATESLLPYLTNHTDQIKNKFNQITISIKKKEI